MSEYIDGLKKAIELIKQSSEADELSMEGLMPELNGAKVASKQAIQSIRDEIVMESGVKVSNGAGIKNPPINTMNDTGVSH